METLDDFPLAETKKAKKTNAESVTDSTELNLDALHRSGWNRQNAESI